MLCVNYISIELEGQKKDTVHQGLHSKETERQYLSKDMNKMLSNMKISINVRMHVGPGSWGVGEAPL